MVWGTAFPTRLDVHSAELRSALASAQSNQSLCRAIRRLSMIQSVIWQTVNSVQPMLLACTVAQANPSPVLNMQSCRKCCASVHNASHSREKRKKILFFC